MQNNSHLKNKKKSHKKVASILNDEPNASVSRSKSKSIRKLDASHKK